jgi:hypothetical protein
MADYHAFTLARTTESDPASLLTSLRASDVTIGVQHTTGTTAYVLKKATAWTAPQITAAQNALETAPVASPQLTAQALIDGWDLATKALVLALIDAINTLRTHPAIGLAAVTPAQALAAIRNKAATL